MSGAVSARTATIVGLVAGAIGIGFLWASGRIDFPFYPPPGILILGAGAVLIALTRWWWAPAVGAFLGLYLLVGFLIAPIGIPNLIGANGPVVSVGTVIQILGVATALVAGVRATVLAWRSEPARAREER